ncbi:malto-oligosyltrehalose synthase [Ramlibacter sp.]|uniref:malto-oligosyltrehalose synthase n=1 Tax=Ramlibacter sp. TaxID=1917967 RepID=UPI003D0E440D
MSDIAELAARWGVSDRYSTFWGEDQVVPQEVLRQALDCMRIDGDAERHGGGLPPVQVVREGEENQIRLGAEHANATRWSIAAEEDAQQIIESGELRWDQDRRVIDLPPHLAPGYYRLALDTDATRWCRLVVAPRRCWTPAALQEGERWWGCTIQLYALRSSRNWGIGDFGDLRRLVDAAAQQGASFIGLSPLHALFPQQPEAASPYSPSSRNALNPLYLDVQALVELAGSGEARERVQAEAFQDRLREMREAELVDYAGVAAAKQDILQRLWRHFETADVAGRTSRGEHFAAYVRQRATTLGPHALFEAIQSHLSAADPNVWGWPAWPEAYRDPRGEAVRAFERDHASEVHYRYWLQWLCETQLESVQRYARTRGMGIGLYGDLAVGVNEGGSETWTRPELFALGMHVGAPPDPLNALGQDWGLPPWNPLQLKAARYAPFIDTLRANMRHCGALRLDHAMALMRLFWIGANGGTYVAYPLDDLLGILALESHRHQCMVIGEDLGNVAPQMREAMREMQLLSYKPLLFERNDDGGFRAPAQWHPQALAVVSTHDLPTLRGFWLGDDVELAGKLSLYPTDDALAQQVLARAQDRAHLLLALQRESLLPEGATVHPTSLPDATPAMVDAVYSYLARTPCWLVGLQLEDIVGQRLQVNVPGTTEDRFPNWRRKLSVNVDDLPAEPRWLSAAAALRAERTGPAALAMSSAELPALDTAVVPLSTYRIQFHKGCSFEQVTAAVPYLHALGIGHLYSSPYLRARPGSTHGYDIVDHAAVNPEVGDALALTRLGEALRRHGMGQMLDIVPNHMGVLEADNAWWLDVLEHGRASSHAETFDIEWSPAAPEMEGRVLLPVLGDHYGKVLEAGEIQLHFSADTGEFGLRYWNHRFPIDPGHYPDILATLPAPPASDDGESDSHAVVTSLLDAFGRLSHRDRATGDAQRARVRDASLYKRRLARLVQRHAWLAQWIAACLQRLNGMAGDAVSFDALDALIARQAYRLADWRVASDDVNYRRFFDVNTLAALRMEREPVFEATHRKVMHWLQEGALDALRIDHPDGLSDPLRYFEQLQRRHANQAIVAGREPRALYLVVEKILAEHEQLPAEWPVHGDTGYRFAALVNAIFVDGSKESAMNDCYRAFTGETLDYDEVVYAAKKLIIDTSLFSELNWLTQALHRITAGNRRRADFTRNRLRAALAEVAANFPVYRTYLRADEPASAMDRQHVDWAVAAAKRRLGGSEIGVIDHLREVLLGDGEAANLPVEPRRRFLARWQQFTAPVTAKSVEDTAFYRYLRLVSLNDVGGEPRSYGLSVAAFHGANQARARYRPHCLLGTSTHDSKRSEDLRARIDVLSEDPMLWQQSLARWSGWTEMYLTVGPEGVMPSRNDIWLFFQTLAGLWPATPPDEAQREDLRARMQAYMLKAVREAKRHTSWTWPEAAYEEALARYVDAVLRPADNNPFTDELQKFTQRIAPFGFRNALSQLALKLTAPGVPDVYQGCEQWNFSLVDPDNRRPVDFARLASELDALRRMYAGDAWPSAADWQSLLHDVANGRVKHLATWRLLQFRRENPTLFRDGNYVALSADGPAMEHVVAYLRTHEAQAVLVVTTRLAYTLCGGDDAAWMPSLWRGTRLRVPADAVSRLSGRWRNALSGDILSLDAESDVEVEALFAGSAALPFVVLAALP